MLNWNKENWNPHDSENIPVSHVFPVEFATSVAEILRGEEEAIKRWIYSSIRPHPRFKYTKLLSGLDFTHGEVSVIANHKDQISSLWITWLEGTWIIYDKDKWTFAIPEIKIVKNPEHHKNNPHLRFATIVFEYSWKSADTYLCWLPKFEKTLAYLDYRSRN